MRLHVLGSGAGGGFPQWNCNCRNCDGLRRGSIVARARTQSSVSVSGDGVEWLLINASPDVLQQVRAHPALQPARKLRDTAIRAVLLMDAQVDHTTGLYMLRERSEPLDIWCTAAVREDLTVGNPILRVLEHYCGVRWHELPLGKCFTVDGIAGLNFTALPLQSKAPPYSPHRNQSVPGDNVGLVMTDVASRRSLFYAPGLGEIEAQVWRAMQEADCVLVDGTFWTEDEMQSAGVANKGARKLGHLPQAGAGGMMEWMARLPAATRKVLIHINNTNPILDENGAERAQLAAAGIEVAWDGMELEL
ncbi:MAG: pyrroloquinoline quinone biosynthesis protein PqqB [Rhodocyclaceae bacterium]|nr:pyrroloquinoline quinone biosynthesis protein PqqB [Rhodocyclaceae bacterium]MBX3669995.1 pyrroloquinoline quinone biosynthesis protein PqqB [Rhodocyclaceae bacterium]